MSAPAGDPTVSIPASAAALAAFVDVLIPGDDLFPPASAVGAHGLLAERLREQHGAQALDRVAAALAKAGGGEPFAGLGGEERVTAVRRFQREEGALFDVLRTVLYYSYYQTPLVVQAIRALGHDYNDAPQPRGYAMTPFDPTPGKDAPATRRGSYKRTDEIVRLDLSGLAGLDPLAEA